MTLAALPESPVTSSVLASAMARAEDAQARAESVSADAQRLVLESRWLRTRGCQSFATFGFFVLQGEVEGIELAPGELVVTAALDEPVPAPLRPTKAP